MEEASRWLPTRNAKYGVGECNDGWRVLAAGGEERVGRIVIIITSAYNDMIIVQALLVIMSAAVGVSCPCRVASPRLLVTVGKAELPV